MDITTAYAADIVKAERDANGDLIVYGKATGTDLDLDGQRCDPAWLKKAMPKWFEYGNVREQHSSIVAGIGIELNEQDNDWYLKALIIDEGTKEKIEKGALKGFSIGAKNAAWVKTKEAPNGLVNRGDIVEVSVVDRPCLPTATLTICKNVGGTMWPMTPAGEPVAGNVTVLSGEGPVRAAATTPRRTRSRGGVTKAAPDLVANPEGGSVLAPTLPGGVPPAPNAAMEAVLREFQARLDADKAATADAQTAPPDTTTTETTEPAPPRPALVLAPFDPFAIDPGEEMRALAYVDKTLRGQLTKASSEQSDIDGAHEAVAVIARLIMSEASGLADGQMGELDDIERLLCAAHALYRFMCSEEREQYATDDDGTMWIGLSAEGDLVKRSYTAQERRDAAASGAAMPGGRYPIEDAGALDDAIHAVGRGKGDHAAIRKHIIARAKKLGLAQKIPQNWNSDGSTTDGKSTAPERTKSVTSTTDTHVAELIQTEIAKARTADEQRIKALEADLAKVKSTPIPGGPVVVAPTRPASQAVTDIRKSPQHLREQAKRTTDPTVRRAYEQAAREIESGALAGASS